MKKANLFLSTMLIAALSAVSATAAPKYSITEIPTLGGLNASASGVNERGQVIGTSDVTFFSNGVNPIYHPFPYSNGVILDLGTLGATNAWAAAINSRGQVAGYTRTLNGYEEAFVYTTGALTALGDLGAGMSQANAINDNGDVVGMSYPQPQIWQAFYYTKGSLSAIGPQLMSSDAIAINNAGQIAGNLNLIDSRYGSAQSNAFQSAKGGAPVLLGCISENPCDNGHASVAYAMNQRGQITGGASGAGYFHAFRWTSGTMTDLGAFDSRGYSIGYAINIKGDVTGYSNKYPGSHAFLYTSGTLKDLGTLGGSDSAGLALNSSSEVVGYSRITDNNVALPNHAFLYSNGITYDLNNLIDPKSNLKSSVTLIAATGITDSGYIIAGGYNSTNGSYRAYLLKKIEK